MNLTSSLSSTQNGITTTASPLGKAASRRPRRKRKDSSPNSMNDKPYQPRPSRVGGRGINRQIMEDAKKSIIEGAYLQGFEPSADNLTEERIFKEAEQYIYRMTVYNS